MPSRPPRHAAAAKSQQKGTSAHRVPARVRTGCLQGASMDDEWHTVGKPKARQAPTITQVRFLLLYTASRAPSPVRAHCSASSRYADERDLAAARAAIAKAAVLMQSLLE